MEISKVVEIYIQLRDKKAEIKAEYDAKVSGIDATLGKAEAALLKHFQENGDIESIKTPFGTAYKSKRRSITMADWDTYFPWLQANGNWHMLERRAAKKAVEEYLEAEGTMPPGLNLVEEITLNVRRS